jgi:hypothetical protein
VIRNGKAYILSPAEPTGSIEIEVSLAEHMRINRVRPPQHNHGEDCYCNRCRPLERPCDCTACRECA